MKSNLNILLVDDDPAICAIIKELLSTLRIGCSSFTRPEEGLTAWRSGDFDAVIVDLIMPKMNGLEFIANAQPETAIVISGKVSSEVGNCLCPRYVFIGKPFGRFQLRSALVKAKLLNENEPYV